MLRFCFGQQPVDALGWRVMRQCLLGVRGCGALVCCQSLANCAEWGVHAEAEGPRRLCSVPSSDQMECTLGTEPTPPDSHNNHFSHWDAPPCSRRGRVGSYTRRWCEKVRVCTLDYAISAFCIKCKWQRDYSYIYSIPFLVGFDHLTWNETILI